MNNKHGDASSLNMYRGITLLSVVSKLFEYALLELFNDSLHSDNLRCGFKKGNGCIDAVFYYFS